MDEQTKERNAWMVLILGGLLLVAGAYQMLNPVLTVSAPTPQAMHERLMATATFTVTGIASCDELNMTLLQAYDADRSGFISGIEFMAANDDQTAGIITQEQLDQVEYAWTHACPVDITLDPARIDDTTDTLSFDKSSYKSGEIVTMTAWGKNIGEETWDGIVTFTVTSPGYTTQIIEISEVSVSAGAGKTITGLFTLPATSATGTWTVQSKWIHESGDIHAYSFMELGTEEIFGMDLNVFGMLMALLGVLLLIGGFMMRGKK